MATGKVGPVSTRSRPAVASGGEVLMTDQTDAESDYQYLHSLSCQSVWSARVAATALDRRPTGMPLGGGRRGGDRKALR